MDVDTGRPPFERKLIGAAVVLVLVVHGALVLRTGVRIAPDTVTYSTWADGLIASHFNYGQFLAGEAKRPVPPYLYMFFVTIVAVLKMIAGASWTRVLVAANVICDAAVAALVTSLTSRLTRSIGATAFAVVAYVAAFDIVTWLKFPLTDLLFLLASFGSFCALAFCALSGRRRIAGPLILALITFALRPVGFLWAVILLIMVLALFRQTSLRALLGLCAIAAVAIFFLHAYVVAHPEAWPLRALSSGVRWDATRYLMGEVVHDRPDIAHRPPVTYGDYVAISADRFAHFFAPSTPSFSRAHKMAAAVYYLPLYALALIAAIGAWRGRSVIDRIVLLSVFAVVLIAWWHSLVIIDYDWRYRVPTLPHFVVLASCGVAVMLEAVSRKRVPAGVSSATSV